MQMDQVSKEDVRVLREVVTPHRWQDSGYRIAQYTLLEKVEIFFVRNNQLQ